MKVYLVGRHTPDFGELDIDIVLQENVTFPKTGIATYKSLVDLVNIAARSGVDALLFQNSPAQLTKALVKAAREFPDSPVRIGIVVSVPGERQAGVQKTFQFTDGNYADCTDEAVRLAKTVNPRAKVQAWGDGTVEITVDPPMRFEFSHIEWLF